jgi:hypothetical protein
VVSNDDENITMGKGLHAIYNKQFINIYLLIAVKGKASQITHKIQSLKYC